MNTLQSDKSLDLAAIAKSITDSDLLAAQDSVDKYSQQTTAQVKYRMLAHVPDDFQVEDTTN